jgi:biopolymer transport protein ExbD
VLGAEERDTSWKASRQVIVSVDERGGLAWEGKPVSRQELDTLLREAAMTNPDLLLSVQSASANVKLENSVGVVTDVYRMAQAYRINIPAGVIGGAAE